ncbi:MAG TPA: putative LPS assembly protein LptD [Holophaga sp.]|nr:putative LPS assembly protein LptD [Holophaga sp.]
MAHEPGAHREAAGPALTALLCAASAWAQAPLPPLPPPASELGAPSPGELLPLRPLAAEEGREGAVPIRYWGRDVQEGPGGWVLLDGAVESPDLLLLADRITYAVATGEVVAEGHIRLEGPGLRLRCERLRMEWKKQVGEAWALDMELPPTWYLRSRKVSFNTLKHWDFEQVDLSPCPQERPGWKAQVSRLTVDLDRYATLRNLWIWVGGVPTPYFLPWAMYPAKAERTSGLLPFSLSFSGPMGASVQIPYYQVLGDTADVTFSPEYFTRQGVLAGLEARWNPLPTHQGSFTGQFIRQRTDEQRRYRFSFKEIWQREDGWQLAADVNRASDQLLDADYGQGMARLGGTPFDSALYVGRAFPWLSVSLAASEQRTFFTTSDSPLYDPNFPNSLNRQVLPSLQASLYPLPLGAFYVDGGLRTGRMTYKLDLAATSGGRIPNDTYAWRRDDGFLRLQGRLGQWGPLRADVETLGRYTHYSRSLTTSLFDVGNAADGSLALTASPFVVDGPAEDRLLGSARLLLSGPPFGRSWNQVSVLGYTGEVKHVLSPYFAVTTNSRASADARIPHFDDVDAQPGVAGSAAGERSLELGLKQHFLGRPGPAASFADLVRWKVSAKYHMTPILLNDGRVQKGWATVDNEIDVEPSEALRISFRRSSDLSDSDADQSLSADYRAGDGTRFQLAYFSTGINRLLVRQKGIQVGGLKRLWGDALRLEFQANYDFKARTFAASQVALAHVTPCVATSLRFSHIGITVPGSVTREDRLDLVLTLRSLGDLGKYTF